LFSPDSRLVAATEATGRLGVWDVPGGRLVTNFSAHSGTAVLLGSSFLRGGHSLLTCGIDGACREWDVTTWQELAHWSLHEQPLHITHFYGSSSASGLLAIKLDNERNVHLIPATDPLNRRQFPCPSRMVGVAFSPDEKTIATVSEDGALALWDTGTLASKGTMRDVLLGLHSVAISPDGRRIAAGGDGREAIKIWDMDSHEDLATLEGPGSLYSNTRFSPDGNMIAARNWNGMLIVWRAPSWGEIEADEQGPGAPVSP
jgi:WD40 repeat protein